MRSTTCWTVAAAVLITAGGAPTVAFADEIVRCESQEYKHRFCPIETHGYVRVERQLSHSECKQGRTWDWDRRGIWVDDGCAAEFRVETRAHTESHPDHKGEKAVAAGAAIALIAAAIAADHDKSHDHYKDEAYHHGGHSSYVPGWMVGEFKGYNLRYGAEVSMRIGGDGRAEAWVNGQKLNGYVNDQRLYIGDNQFFIDRAGDGFNTTQVGDAANQVHYSRR